MHYDYLIIGGGIAGVSAAETIREHMPRSSIGVLSDESHPLYSRVLLPSYIKKKIPREKVFLRTLADFIEKRIDLQLAQEVVRVDAERNEVFLANGNILSYGKLLLATGGKVNEWPEGNGKNAIFRLQTIDDADAIVDALSLIRSPLVVGSSFIGLEFLEIFYVHGISSTLIARDSHFFSSLLDVRGGELMHENFVRYGISVIYNDSIRDIGRRDGEIFIATNGLRQLQYDAIAVGVGIKRAVGFLKDSGIVFSEEGVHTNEFLQTNYENIYAAGDNTFFRDAVADSYCAVGNWTNAFLQGKRAGLNMAGTKEPFRNISHYSITNLGIQITALGNCKNPEESIVKVDAAANRYLRLFINKNRIVGAVLINSFHYKPHLTNLIESKTSIAEYRDAILKDSFDIRNIAVIPYKGEL